ncbi:tol-pal system protein YbgF [Psychrosphaera saromensis]|jgi:tol-pal system protein YbgF|uniref:Cell division coordinator CpoB n=1 Tax=Psychrosphaera saromensis TaxID=716813 RepID=A0A2S7UY00_9GAMM|nr:tol-pal system protein YbgF [Psychrosphaera saromensis]PQJ54876.1 tol-pal system protein YbgF [Psychrosphaera saromensis]GHB56445.1 tol-pal system protein YbgF [Psychrosphaera saromensis]GLQ13881.1 tol-pal system protein YbgF [Psychrosphaera saromensis]
MKFSLISLLVVSGAAYSAAPIDNASSSAAIAEQLNQLKRLMQARGAAQINLQQQLVEVQDELRELKGESENQAHKLDQIVERQRDLYIEIERRLTNIQAPTQTPVATTAPSSETTYSTSLSESEAYDQAVNLILKDRRYDEAIPEFKNFIKSFPKSVYIANAHYWLGQLLFNKSLFADAKTHFDQVIRNHPESTKRSDSMLKQATVMQKLGDKNAAKALFEQVISEYPDSTSASLAKSRLSAL